MVILTIAQRQPAGSAIIAEVAEVAEVAEIAEVIRGGRALQRVNDRATAGNLF